MTADRHTATRAFQTRRLAPDPGRRGRSLALTRPIIVRFLVLYPLSILTVAGLLATDLVATNVDAPINVMTAHIAAWLMNALGLPSVAHGVNLTYGGLTVAVRTGCSGLEVLGVLLPAIVLFPAPARAKLIGVLAAVAVVVPLNAVRVASLSLLLATSTRAFDLAHLYFWQAALIGALFAFFLAWVRTVAWPVPARS